VEWDFKMNKADILKGLNKEQKEAVCYTGGPLLIIAGAGTGKTEVITRKIAYLINEKIAKSEEILALTFTKKAAREMEERVDLLVPYGYIDFKIGTFHSVAEEIVREFAYFLKIPSNFKVVTLPNQVQLINKNIFSLGLDKLLPLSDPTSLSADLIKFFSRLKDEAIDELSFEKFAISFAKKNDEQRYLLEIASAYRRYQELMLAANFCDYNDLILNFLKLLENDVICRKLQARYPFILVDEYQDTNWAQGELVKKLAGKGKGLTVVGDDDQAIYKFRGASLASLLEFRKNFPKSKIVVLKKNYRSAQKILDLAYSLIQNNNPDRLEKKLGFDKRLLASRAQKGRVERLGFADLFSEAEFVAKEIIKLKKKEKAAFSDFAILVRANSRAKPFMQALARLGIPYVFSGDLGLFSKKEIINIAAFINYLTNPLDSLAFLHLVTGEFFNLNVSKVSAFLFQLKKKNLTINQFLQNEILIDEIDQGFLEEIKSVVAKIEKFRKLSLSWTAGELIFRFLDEIGYRKKLATEENKGSIEAAEKMESLASFFDYVKSFDEANNDRSIHNFAEFLRVIQELGEEKLFDERTTFSFDAVNILTIHRAKGLEFKTVFLVDLLDSRFPGSFRGEKLPFPEELLKEERPSGNVFLQEERRLFYVAVTRAKNNLYFTHSLDVGGKKTAKVSRFLIEIFGEKLIEEKYQKPSAIARLDHYRREEKIGTGAKIKKEEILVLSRMQIDDWLTCPRKYKYINVTPIKMSSEPVIMYGNAVHNALEFLFKTKLIGKIPDLEEVLDVYRKSWIAEGFISPEHEEKKFKAGIRALTDFYQNRLFSFSPLAVEKKFKFKVGKIWVTGRFDLVEKGRDGRITITDFKTGEKITSEKAKKRARESRQLKIYALAYEAIEGKLPDKLSLFFVDEGIKETILPSELNLKKTREEIGKAAEGINKGIFKATPSLNVCRYCAFKKYCDKAILD